MLVAVAVHAGGFGAWTISVEPGLAGEPGEEEWIPT